MANTHGQHYLLSAKARSLSLMQIMRLSDDQAFEMFKEARWGKGPVACPCCGGVEHYWLKNRSQLALQAQRVRQAILNHFWNYLPLCQDAIASLLGGNRSLLKLR